MADVTLALTGVAGVGAVGTAAPGLSVALTTVETEGVVGRVLVQRQPAQGMTLATPALQLALTGVTGTIGSLALDMPAPSIAFSGLSSLSGRLRLTAPSLQLQLTGLVGSVGRLALTMPRPVLAVSGGSRLNLEMPPLRLVMRGAVGSLAQLRLTMPPLQLALTGTTPIVGALRLRAPALRLALTGGTGGAGRLALRMRKLSLAISGVTGTLGTLTLRMPLPELGFAGHRSAEGVLELAIPRLHLVFNGQTGVAGSGGGAGGGVGVGAAAATTLVMHTERGALSQYVNYPFNSFCVVDGVYLGASEDGLFALTGDTDDGAIIEASARLGITDFGTSHHKRIERVYVGLRTDGRMVLRVVTDDTKTRDYLVQRAPSEALHGAQVNLGRGLEARYWQFELRNQDGCDFSADMLEMKPIKLRRRTGSGHA